MDSRILAARPGLEVQKAGLGSRIAAAPAASVVAGGAVGFARLGKELEVGSPVLTEVGLVRGSLEVAGAGYRESVGGEGMKTGGVERGIAGVDGGGIVAVELAWSARGGARSPSGL